jgi:aldehyde:ferredoxin oxidoreductase
MNYGGWTGKVLRVDLSTGNITTEDTSKYKDYLGGTGLAYKVLWDEVPAGTKAWDPENRLIFGTGPITGSGSPCSGRVSITSLFPPHPDELPGTGHMGGHWGPELKYAGWDSIIVQGKAASPVWIKIVDDKVTIESASTIWGQGIYRATAHICTEMGAGAHVVAIGQAGENLARLSCILCDRSHSAGGLGSVMGSKNLKAIGVVGTGAVKIAADKKTWKDLTKYFLSLMGCNNQGVVAQTLQPWSEFSPAGTRWWAAPGRPWGAANPPVDTGICADVEHPSAECPSPLNKMGMRTHKGYGDFKDEGAKRTVRMDGCHACPIRCHIATDVPLLEQYGASRYNMNTCSGNNNLNSLYTNVTGTVGAQEGQIVLSQMSNYIADDYGIWCDYGQYQRDFVWYLATPIVVDENNPATVPDPANPGQTLPNPDLGKMVAQKYLEKCFPTDRGTGVAVKDSAGKPISEWAFLNTKLWNTGKTPLQLLAAGDPRFMQFIGPYMAANRPNTLGAFMAMGPGMLEKLWPDLKTAHDKDELDAFKMGHAKHHGVETQLQLGGLKGMLWNRDPMDHTLTNFSGNGLPTALKKAIAKELLDPATTLFTAADGSDPWDAPGTWTDMNMAKAAMIARCAITLELHNSLTCCNYTLPIWASPLKSRNYRGDDTLDAQVYSAVTGDAKTQKDLETVGLRILTLFRALTAMYMEKAHPGCVLGDATNPDVPVAAGFSPGKFMRGNHDYAYDWMYAPNSTTIPLRKPDVEAGKTMLYTQLGWDGATGMPTRATLVTLGIADVADRLESLHILPA